MKEKKYVKLTNYIINNRPCTSELVAEFNMSSAAVSAVLCAIRNKDERLYRKLHAILEENSYRNLKGYKLAIEIIELDLSMPEAVNHFGYSEKKILNLLDALQERKPDLLKKTMQCLNKPAKSNAVQAKPLKCVQIGQYIVDNNCSDYHQAVSHFNLRISTFWAAVYKLKSVNKPLYDQVKAIIGGYTSKNACNLVADIPKYEQYSYYIITNKATIEETAKYFNTSVLAVNQAVNVMLKRYNQKWYQAIRNIIDNRPAKAEQMIQDMVDNQMSIVETARKWNIHKNRVLANIASLESTNPDLYKAAQPLKKKHLKYVQLANFMIDTNASIEETAQKFGIDKQIVRIYIHNMRKAAPELYEKVSGKLA